MSAFRTDRELVGAMVFVCGVDWMESGKSTYMLYARFGSSVALSAGSPAVSSPDSYATLPRIT